MKALQLLILFSIIVLSFTTCKKYPEGGWSNAAIRHLFGKNSSYAHKTWRLKKYEVNEIDSTGFIIAGNGVTSFKNDEVDFRISGKASLKDYYASSKVYDISISFINKKKAMSIWVARQGNSNINGQCNSSICERNIFNPFNLKEYVEWNIIKLKDDELIITTTQNNNNYKISLTS